MPHDDMYITCLADFNSTICSPTILFYISTVSSVKCMASFRRRSCSFQVKLSERESGLLLIWGIRRPVHRKVRCRPQPFYREVVYRILSYSDDSSSTMLSRSSFSRMMLAAFSSVTASFIFFRAAVSSSLCSGSS